MNIYYPRQSIFFKQVKCFGISTALMLLAVANLSAQHLITNASQLTAKVLRYKKAEWNIQIKGGFKNPYDQKEISLDMALTAPSGKRLLLPCYYEQGDAQQSMWKARFTPQEAGVYQYHFQCKNGAAVVSATKSASFKSKATRDNGILHKKDDWGFQYDNGKAFRGIGENLAWESRASDDSKFFKELHEKSKYNYEYMLPALAAHGGNYFRTWICSWNLPLDWKAGFNNHRYTNSNEYFNPSAIKKLDRMVELSDSLQLHIMLTLGPGSYDEKNGRYQTSTADFFVNEKAKEQYKDRLRFIVARWGYSPAIGAWEFFNEIDNIQFRDSKNPISAESIVKWHDEMSAYLKALDPYEHLVTTSISHRDLKGLNDIAAIDFNQKHIYKNNRALPTTIVKYTSDFKKPYVIGEYGYEYDWSKNFNLFANEMDSDFKRGLWYGLFSPTPVLPLSWWWEFFDDRGTDAYMGKVRPILNQMLAAGKGSFETIEAKSSLPAIEMYSVKCGNKIFVYAYNAGSEAKQFNITIPLLSGAAKKIKYYDCESGNYKSIKGIVTQNQLLVNGFGLAANSDAVLIIDAK